MSIIHDSDFTFVKYKNTVIFLTLVLGVKIFYPDLLYTKIRSQVLYIINDTSFGQYSLSLLRQLGIYDHHKKIKHLRKEYALALYQLMYDLHNVMEAVQIPYWIDGGTLLGAIRHNGLIPWDDDLDIQIYESNRQSFLQIVVPILEELGYQVINDKIITSDQKFARLPEEKPPSCDIFFARPKEGRLDIGWPHAIRVEDLKPLKCYRFGSFEVWGPSNPFPYLFALYGKNCLKQAYRGYDHLSQQEGHESSMVPFVLNKQRLDPAQPTGPVVDNTALIRRLLQQRLKK